MDERRRLVDGPEGRACVGHACGGGESERITGRASCSARHASAVEPQKKKKRKKAGEPSGKMGCRLPVGIFSRHEEREGRPWGHRCKPAVKKDSRAVRSIGK